MVAFDYEAFTGLEALYYQHARHRAAVAAKCFYEPCIYLHPPLFGTTVFLDVNHCAVLKWNDRGERYQYYVVKFAAK